MTCQTSWQCLLHQREHWAEFTRLRQRRVNYRRTQHRDTQLTIDDDDDATTSSARLLRVLGLCYCCRRTTGKWPGNYVLRLLLATAAAVDAYTLAMSIHPSIYRQGVCLSVLLRCWRLNDDAFLSAARPFSALNQLHWALMDERPPDTVSAAQLSRRHNLYRLILMHILSVTWSYYKPQHHSRRRSDVVSFSRTINHSKIGRLTSKIGRYFLGRFRWPINCWTVGCGSVGSREKLALGSRIML